MELIEKEQAGDTRNKDSIGELRSQVGSCEPGRGSPGGGGERLQERFLKEDKTNIPEYNERTFDYHRRVWVKIGMKTETKQRKM